MVLDETIIVEIRIKNNKKVFILLTYRTPSMKSPQIDEFCRSLSVMVNSMKKENPSSIILTGDFNGRSPHFWEDELVENYAGKSLVEF